MRVEPRRWRWVLGGHAAGVLLFLYLPLATLVGFSFSASRYSGLWGGFTLEWYARLFRNEALWRALGHTLAAAGASSLLAAVIGTAAAMGIARSGRRARRVLEPAAYLPLLVPDIIFAVALLVFYALVLRLELGLAALVCAYVVFNTSYVAVVVGARLKGQDPALEEAAADLGASRWQAFRLVRLPLILPGVLGGSLLAFALALDEFVAAFFLTGPGTATLPVEVHAMVKRGVTPEINALATLMLGATIVLAAAAALLQRRRPWEKR